MLWRHTFAAGPLMCNCTLIADTIAREALIVDPSGEPEMVLELLKARRLHVRAIVHTHGHIDHVAATAPLQKATQAPCYMHADDKPLYDNLSTQAQMTQMPEPEAVATMHPIAEGDVIGFGEFAVKILHTPGHSPGSICLMLDARRLCISGDTLFCKSVGRWDLWGGDRDVLSASIKKLFLYLKDDTQVVPGHGPQTLAGDERRHNAFVLEALDKKI